MGWNWWRLVLLRLRPQAIVEGAVREPDSIARTIRQLATNLKIKEKFVATSISGYAVMIKKN